MLAAAATITGENCFEPVIETHTLEIFIWEKGHGNWNIDLVKHDTLGK